MNLKMMDDIMDAFFVAKKAYEALPPLPEGIKPIYHRVLNLLYRNQEEGLMVSELSEVLQMQLPNMTKLINEMVSKGFVQKVRSPKDKRVVFIRITNEGNEYFTKHVLVYRNQLQEEFNQLNEEDCKTMIEMIQLIQQKIVKVYARKEEN